MTNYAQGGALPPLATLVPHAGPMLLLDRLISVDREHLQAEVTIRPERLFCGAAGVGAWVGIEYMAQAAAAFAGYHAMQSGQPLGPGFLLGTRSYTSGQPCFAPGSVLRILAQPVGPAVNGLAMFQCSISAGDDKGDGEDYDEIASATISVFQPPHEASGEHS